MPIATKVVSSNPVHVEVYSIQQYVIKFVSNLERRWFSQDIPVSSTNKTGRHNIADILLKVVLNTITLNLSQFVSKGVSFTEYMCMTLKIIYHRQTFKSVQVRNNDISL